MKVINTLRRNRRYRMARGQWLALHNVEASQPWKKLNISRSTYFARRKRRKEAIARKRQLHGLAQIKLRDYLTETAPQNSLCLPPAHYSDRYDTILYERGGGNVYECMRDLRMAQTNPALSFPMSQ